jgi:hypothetical protein
LFVEQAVGELIEDAVKRAEFDEVWAVLQAMQEQDELLADIIRQMREDRGRTGGFDDSRFRERVEALSPDLTLETLSQTINTLCLDRLGSLWDERFGELQAYKERYGHCRVPDRCSQHPQLGTWVRNVRVRGKKAIFSQERIQRLNQIGFVWDAHDTSWEQMFSELLGYKQAYGHCNVPHLFAENSQLGKWVHKQRQKKRDCQLEEERILRLDEIGFTWNPSDAVWEEMFAALVVYKEIKGHCNVPKEWSENPKLGSWVGQQRQNRKAGTLSENRIQRLNDLGFMWDTLDALWEKRFSELEEFRAIYTHSNVPQRWQENPQLATWVSEQRTRRKQDSLSQERIQRLNETGFLWNPRDSFWEQKFAELQAFKESKGHCNVSSRYSENPSLATWVDGQRQYKKKGKLSEERIRRLDELGFEWNPKRWRRNGKTDRAKSHFTRSL